MVCQSYGRRSHASHPAAEPRTRQPLVSREASAHGLVKYINAVSRSKLELLTRVAGSLPQGWLTTVARLQFRFPALKRPVGWLANRFRNRNGKISKGVGRGLKFNPGSANAGYRLGTSEPGVQAALTQLVQPRMTVYDIGANVGFFSVIAARLVGPDGQVVAFEPVLKNCDQLTLNAQLNSFTNVTVRCEALGNENGCATFFATHEPTLGRLKKFGAPEPGSDEITVAVRQLDRLIIESGLPQPDLIKMDVEGAEVDVLLGASEILATARPLLLIELHGTNDPVAILLEQQGYALYVLGNRGSVREALWNAHLIAVPKERADLANEILALTDPALAE